MLETKTENVSGLTIEDCEILIDSLEGYDAGKDAKKALINLAMKHAVSGVLQGKTREEVSKEAESEIEKITDKQQNDMENVHLLRTKLILLRRELKAQQS